MRELMRQFHEEMSILRFGMGAIWPSSCWSTNILLGKVGQLSTKDAQDVIVIACNTATVAVWEEIKAQLLFLFLE